MATNMHYLIKREKCGWCDDNGQISVYPHNRPELAANFPCMHCTNGYIETRVDADLWLLDRLKALQWDDCSGRLSLPQYFDNPRFKGE